jgi:hypothetical protein
MKFIQAAKDYSAASSLWIRAGSVSGNPAGFSPP